VSGKDITCPEFREAFSRNSLGFSIIYIGKRRMRNIDQGPLGPTLQNCAPPVPACPSTSLRMVRRMVSAAEPNGGVIACWRIQTLSFLLALCAVCSGGFLPLSQEFYVGLSLFIRLLVQEVDMSNLTSVEVIASKILFLRGKRVMLDKDLAKLYGVETKHLNRQVRRNLERFPADFLIRLTREEYNEILRCQFGTLETGKYSKYLPYAFTEQGVAMLSSVLNSKKAILVNIQIMRAFTQLRRMLLTNKDLKRKIEKMERRYDKQFTIVFQAIKQLLGPPAAKEKKIIGFQIHRNSQEKDLAK